MIYHFDMDKFWRKLKHLSLGTGTLATRAGVSPDDVQRLITTEEADEDVAKKVLAVLSKDVLAYDPDESEDDVEQNASPDYSRPTYTIKEIKEEIAAGRLTLKDALERETATEDPRKTLITWLMEEVARSNSTEA